MLLLELGLDATARKPHLCCPMIDNPWFYALAIPAVIIAGISKAGFAGGVGLVAVPMMALVISPVQAAGIMLPLLIAMDGMSIVAYRKKFDARNLKLLLPGAVIGIALGTLTFGFVNEDVVRLLIGVVAAGFSVYFLRPQSVKLSPSKGGPTSGILCGAAAGFTSFVSHAGSPPVQLHLMPQQLDKSIYVGTTVMFFGVVNLLKLPPYALLGQLAPGNLMTSLALVPCVPIGIALGLWLHKIIPADVFYRVCYGGVFLVGLKLLWDGVSGLMA